MPIAMTKASSTRPISAQNRGQVAFQTSPKVVRLAGDGAADGQHQHPVEQRDACEGDEHRHQAAAQERAGGAERVLVGDLVGRRGVEERHEGGTGEQLEDRARHGDERPDDRCRADHRTRVAPHRLEGAVVDLAERQRPQRDHPRPRRERGRRRHARPVPVAVLLAVAVRLRRPVGRGGGAGYPGGLVRSGPPGGGSAPAGRRLRAAPARAAARTGRLLRRALRLVVRRAPRCLPALAHDLPPSARRPALGRPCVVLPAPSARPTILPRAAPAAGGTGVARPNRTPCGPRGETMTP